MTCWLKIILINWDINIALPSDKLLFVDPGWEMCWRGKKWKLFIKHDLFTSFNWRMIINRQCQNIRYNSQFFRFNFPITNCRYEQLVLLKMTGLSCLHYTVFITDWLPVSYHILFPSCKKKHINHKNHIIPLATPTPSLSRCTNWGGCLCTCWSTPEKWVMLINH